MRAPTTNPITQGRHGQYNAVDYSARPDTTIYAPEAGKVTFYANAGDCGNNMQLQGAGRRHGFCHLERALVSVGQQVQEGQPIGIMGYTGLTIPAGPNGRHLHWVIQKGGVYVYPPSLITSQVNNNQGDEPMISDVDNEYGRWNKLFVQIRGRNASRDEFRKAAVGRSWLRAMEILSDDREADQATADGNLGALARRDNWQDQIYSLQDALRVTNERLAQVSAKADLTDKLQKQVDELVASNAKLVEERAKDEQTGQSFLRWLGDQLNKLLGKG